MALSTCIKCGGNHFEYADVEPIGSRVKVEVFQCASCGGVIGLSMKRVLREIDIVESKVKDVQRKVK